MLLQNLLESFPERISSYACQIKTACLHCLKSEVTAAEKVKALEVLQSVLKLNTWDQNLKISELITTLENCYLKSKAQPTVQQHILHILGIIAHRYPEKTNQKSLLNRYSFVIRSQKLTSKQSFVLIIGCLKGLSEFLYEFELCSDDSGQNTAVCVEIHDLLKQLIASLDSQKRIAQRIALSIIELHGNHFAEMMYKEYKWWHSTLLLWIEMPDKDKKAGIAALQSFYDVIADVLCKETDDRAKTVFEYFMGYFHEKMASKSTPTAVLHTVIKAFGDFSKACESRWSSEDVEYAFCFILQCAEGICLEYSTQEDVFLRMKRVWHLPQYLESLGKLLLQKEIIHYSQQLSLEHITVLLIQIFPHAYESTTFSIIKAMQSFFCNLSLSKLVLLEDFINVVVYQGLIHTCSHCLLIDMELQKERQNDGQKIITYKNYMPLWKSLFLAHNYRIKGPSAATKTDVVQKMHNQFVILLLRCLRKLNLNTRKKILQDSDSFFIEGDMEAVNPKDFNVFINLTDFCQEFFPHTDSNLFKNHCEEFITHLIVESTRAPNVSGFYKLLAAALKICDKLQFFGESLVVDKTREVCYWNVVNFLWDSVKRLQQYTGDLLIASLQLVLSCPAIIIHPIIKETGEIFLIIFSIANSYLELGHNAMDSLEKWTKEIPSEDMDTLITKVLPYMEPFLQSKSAGLEKDMELQVLQTERKLHQPRRRIRKFKRGSTELPQTELVRLQWRILHFLGSLRSDITPALLANDPLAVNTAWGHTTHLPFMLPFNDMRATIFFDQFLPRIIDLALNSGDRKTRVVSCELLQAVVMLMLGMKWHREEETKAELFRRIISAVIKLGCDTDQVVLQIFYPLALQMIHWYSSRFQYNTKYCIIVVEVIMDGITHPTDSSLRKFSCKCLHEFIVWSVRQLKQEELEKSPLNIEAVVKRICFLCTHPSFSKRLGSALAFNSIYRKLREEKTIIDRFWFDLLYYMLSNLSIADIGDSIIGAVKEVRSAVYHIKRVLQEKPDLFNQISEVRHKPPEFDGVQLIHAVTWLLKQCGSLQIDCRRTSMDLVMCLASLIPGVKTTKEFVSKLVSEKGVAYVTRICDAGHILEFSEDFENLQRSQQWLTVLTARLDCYIWFIEEELLQLSVLLLHNGRIFQAAIYFVKKLGLKGADDDLCATGTPTEVENYRRYKFVATERLLYFIFIVCKASQQLQPVFPSDFLSSNELWEFISCCLIKPTEMGFGADFAETHQTFLTTMEKLMKILKANLPPEALNCLLENLSKLLRNYSDLLFGSLETSFKSDTVHASQRDAVQAMSTLIRSELFEQVIERHSSQQSFSKEIFEKLLSSIVINESVPKVAINLQPSGKVYAKLLIELAFLADGEIDELINLLLYGPKVYVTEKAAMVRHGEHFLAQLREPVLDGLLRKHSGVFRVVELLIGDSLQPERSGWPLRFLEQLLQRAAHKDAKLELSVADGLGCKVLASWELLKNWANDIPTRKWQVVDLLVQTVRLLKQPVGCFTRYAAIHIWLREIITSENLSLHEKNRTLDLLPGLVNVSNAEDQSLWALLLDLQSHHFPLSTSELHEGSMELTCFVTCFHKLLSALEISGNKVFLKAIIVFSAGDNGHICAPSIEKLLPKLTGRLTSEKQQECLETAFSVFSNRVYDSNTRLGSIEKFLVPLVKYSSISAIQTFYAKYIKDIMKNLSSMVEDTNIFITKHDIVSKFGASQLLDVLHFKCSKEVLEDKASPITNAAFPGAVIQGKELMKEIVKRLKAFRSIEKPSNAMEDPVVLELFRKMQCAAYNGLVAVITNTKFEETFVSGFLFSENQQKIWENLVDCETNLTFAMDWENVPRRRKMLVNLRQKCDGAGNAMDGAQPINYIPSHSQFLLHSSLAEDVTQFDFTLSVVRPLGPPGNVNEQMDGTEIDLEMDIVNQHVCMPVLCALLQNMYKQNLITVPQPGEKGNLPSFMENMKKCLLSDRHRNVKIFIVKLILNNENIFLPFANHWLYPLLLLIKDGSFGNELNYFITDVLALLLSWSGRAIPDSNDYEKKLTSDVFRFLIEHSFHRRRDIMKHNLELIKTVVELWKSCLTVPYDLILDYLKKKYETDKDAEFGIQLVGAICCNKINPWDENTVNNVLDILWTKMDVNSREVYLPCSELVGIILKRMHDEDDISVQPDNKFLSNVRSVLNKLSYKSRDKYLLCLHGVQKHYPQVVDKTFMQDVAFNLKKCQGSFKTLSLEIMLSGIETLGEDAYGFLKSNGLLDFVDQPDTGAQLAALRVLEKLLLLDRDNSSICHMKYAEKQSLLDAVCPIAVKRSTAASCRHLAFQILSSDTDAHEGARKALLSGLADSDPDIKEFVLRYWRSDSQLPVSASERLIYILNHLYSTETEVQFLGYALQVLLEACTTSPDYNRNIYLKPLEECHFEEYPISVSWRAQNISLVPLFAETLASQANESLMDATAIIRATQDSLEFSPTLNAERRTFAESYQQNPAFTLTSSSLFSTRSNTAPQNTKSSSSAALQGISEQNVSTDKLKRRFLRDEKKIRYYFAKREVRRTMKIKELQAERSKKEATVSLFRKYRKGDLPDIEIQFSAFIKPLQALAKMDVVIAQQLLTAIFAGILKGLSENEEDFTDRIKQVFEDIFEKTVACPPSLIGSIIEMALLSPQSIILDVEKLSAVCRAASLFSTGCLLLENYIINDVQSLDPIPTKRQKGPTGDIHWLRLAELYTGLGDWNSVQGIFRNSLETSENLKKALVCQADMEWKPASLHYRNALKDTSCEDLQDFCRSSYYKCLAHLSSWDSISAEIRHNELNNNWNEVWSEPWYTEKMLPFLFAAQIQLKLKGSDCSEFESCVEEWLADEEKKSTLVQSMSEELSILDITNNKFINARIHAEQYLSLFLQQWAEIGPASYAIRSKRLMDLQRITEIMLYLDIANISNLEADLTKLEQFMKPWATDLPSATSSLEDWERKVLYRCYFLKQTADRLSSDSATDDLSWLKTTEVVCRMTVTDLALLQKNYFVAKKYAVGMKEEVEICGDEAMNIQHSLHILKLALLKASKSAELKKKFSLMVEVLDKLSSLQRRAKNNNCLSELISVNEEQCRFSQDLLSVLRTNQDKLRSLSSSDMDILLRCVGSPRVEPDELLTAIKKHGFKAATEAVHVAEHQLRKNSCSTVEDRSTEHRLADLHLKLAQYCRSHYGPDTQNYDITIVTSLLKAMKYGSAEARQLFPCLLELHRLPTELLDEFKTQSASVPEWMFLGWVSQILASLDSPVGIALHELVIRMAKAYPRALVYAFKVSAKKYTFDEISETSESARIIVDRLKTILLSDTIVEEFTNAFSWLCLPRILLGNELKNLSQLLEAGVANLNQFKIEFQEMLNRLFVSRREMPSQGSSALCGEIFSEIDKYYPDENKRSSKSQIQKGEIHLGAVLTAVNSGNIQEALEIIQKCRKELHNKSKSTKSTYFLWEFSPWLKNFQGDKWGNDLEIPGQYTGESRPLPHLHIKIANFHPEVIVLHSMRKPIRLTMLGNDAKEHHCIIKHGEDLRLDQRIQQLFSLMTKMLTQDSVCREQQLRIKTYQVVPLSSNLGFIQWVDNTKSLSELIESSYTGEEKTSAREASTRYRGWLAASNPSKKNLTDKEKYESAYRKYSPEETVKIYNENVNSIPWDIMRRVIWNVSTTAEIFFTKRHRFASSYATMCIGQWLLGIGDRNLGNCLVFPHTGECLGVDFGYAFGTATEFLPVPELMPFRLTPHIVNLMEPHKTSGVIEETMVHVLRLLRNNHQILLATMKVFVQEPSLDWLFYAKRKSPGNVQSDPKRFSREKVELARKKFEGISPAVITEEELLSGHSDPTNFRTVLWGPSTTLRYTFGRKLLTPHDQVKCLIEQATDPHILGKTWEGWQPWI
ncbi:DNA-dependent protein kinase catalytic subunit-like [Schistocerca americana]|uniref:DNA-dependent protein kinase catalytic subunit-like n=1 Tax=Schistocerca americana TaxID=7009 RepID=UPI001F4F4BBA|nr:DNA-dependent protein kinase catalytic subunit-like [Schistocerca americana]